jgi:hypothetical protein
MLAKERVRELRESQSLILFYQFESSTREELRLQGIKEEEPADEIDESEYVILEDYKQEELGASVMVLPSKEDTERQRKNSFEKLVRE